MDGPLGAFFKQFLPEFLSKMEDLDSNQREKLQATFNEEIVSINYWITSKVSVQCVLGVCNIFFSLQDLPTFTWNLTRFISDLRYYKLCNASLPAGSVSLSM